MSLGPLTTRAKLFLGAVGLILLLLVVGRNPFCWNFACRDFAVLDLDIPGYFFPEGSQIVPFHRPRGLELELESGVLTVFWDFPHGIAVYAVDRLPFSGMAISRFNTMFEQDKIDYREDIDLRITSEGDPVFWGCGVSEFGGYRCFYEAVYDEYYVSFNAVIDDEMTYEEFEEIVAFIDGQISEKLND